MVVLKTLSGYVKDVRTLVQSTHVECVANNMTPALFLHFGDLRNPVLRHAAKGGCNVANIL